MYQFQVEGMHCGGCADGLDEALKRIDSAGALSADIKNQTIEVRTQVSSDQIRQMIEEAGYRILNLKTVA